MCPIYKIVQGKGGKGHMDMVDTGERRLNNTERARLQQLERKKMGAKAPTDLEDEDATQPLVVTSERAQQLEQAAAAAKPAAKPAPAAKGKGKGAKAAAAPPPPPADEDADGELDDIAALEADGLDEDGLGEDDDEDEPPARFPCAKCDFVAGSPAGLASHVNNRHAE